MGGRPKIALGGAARELCEKLGVAPDAWRHTHLQVETYQVDEFQESEFASPDQP